MEDRIVFSVHGCSTERVRGGPSTVRKDCKQVRDAPLSYVRWRCKPPGPDSLRYRVPTGWARTQCDIAFMNHMPHPDQGKALPLVRSYAALQEKFARALALELMVAKARAQSAKKAQPDESPLQQDRAASPT